MTCNCLQLSHSCDVSPCHHDGGSGARDSRVQSGIIVVWPFLRTPWHWDRMPSVPVPLRIELKGDTAAEIKPLPLESFAHLVCTSWAPSSCSSSRMGCPQSLTTAFRVRWILCLSELVGEGQEDVFLPPSPPWEGHWCVYLWWYWSWRERHLPSYTAGEWQSLGGVLQVFSSFPPTLCTNTANEQRYIYLLTDTFC